MHACASQLVFICVVVIALQRVIERALQIEFSDAIRKDRIVCGVDDALILEKIKEPPLRNHCGDLRVVT